MADKKDDKGPYQIKGRRVAGGQEETLGQADKLEDATQQADALYHAGGWHNVDVYDRDNMNVLAAHDKDRQDKGPRGHETTEEEQKRLAGERQGFGSSDQSDVPNG